MADRAIRRGAGSLQKKACGVPYPFTEAVVDKAILELPDGARLAVSTCLDLWRDKKFGTDEFVSFMKCYAEQSETLATFFAKEIESSSHSDSTGGANSVHNSSRGGDCLLTDDGTAASEHSKDRTGSFFLSDAASVDGAGFAHAKSDPASASSDADGNRNSSGSSPQNPNGSSPHTAGSDSDKGCDKGYMGSASESNGHSSRSNGGESGSNGGESSSTGYKSNGNTSSSQGHSSRESGSGSGSGEHSSGSDSGGKGNSPTCASPSEEALENPRRNSVDKGATSTSKSRKRQASFSDSGSKTTKTDSTGCEATGPAGASSSSTGGGGSRRSSSKRSRYASGAGGAGSAGTAMGSAGGQARLARGGGMLGTRDTSTPESGDDSASSALGRQLKGAAGSGSSTIGGASERAAGGCDGADGYGEGEDPMLEPSLDSLGADDHRWFPGMRMDAKGSLSMQAPGEDLEQTRWASKLARTDLGELLTSKANMALGSSSAVTVRVVSKVLCSLKAPSLNAADAAAASVKSSTHGRRAGGWEGGDGEQNKTTVTYTRKAILTFQHLKGADVLIMGMYVQQYGPDSSPLHKGRVLIECIDSPPVWPSFPGAARKAILTAVVLGYIEWAASRGFKFLYLHVPPPQESSNYILVRRSLNFRLRVTMHLSYWFKQVLDEAIALGVVTSYQCSSSRADFDFPPGILESLSHAPAGDGGGDLMVDGVGSLAWQCKHVCFNEKFFLSMLATSAVGASRFASLANSTQMPNKFVADRADLSKLIRDKGLFFHTLSHAQYATMVLVHSIAAEQRANNVTDNLTPGIDRDRGMGAGIDREKSMGGGHMSSHLTRDHHLSSLLHAPGPMCGARMEEDDTDYSMPYHMHMAAEAQAHRRAWEIHAANPLKSAGGRVFGSSGMPLARGVGGVVAAGRGLGGSIGVMGFSPAGSSLSSLPPAQRMAQDAAKSMLALQQHHHQQQQQEQQQEQQQAVAWPPDERYLGDMVPERYGMKGGQWPSAGLARSRQHIL